MTPSSLRANSSRRQEVQLATSYLPLKTWPQTMVTELQDKVQNCERTFQLWGMSHLHNKLLGIMSKQEPANRGGSPTRQWITISLRATFSIALEVPMQPLRRQRWQNLPYLANLEALSDKINSNNNTWIITCQVTNMGLEKMLNTWESTINWSP